VRVLVTNDDGIESPGLHALAGIAAEAGHDVIVAAPAREASGASASLSAVDEQGRIVVDRRVLPGLPDVEAYAAEASPAYIALVATRGGFGPAPELVLSGINLGANTGIAVLHSGTVGAALTGAVNGCHAMAVSLDIGLNPDGPPRWDVAAAIAAEVLPLAGDTPRGVVINVNVPNRAHDELRGIQRATLATFGVVQMTMHERGQGFVKMSLEQRADDLEPGSDEAGLLAGYVTITPIRPPSEAADVSLPVPEKVLRMTER
jgi:5'-nucleotidase